MSSTRPPTLADTLARVGRVPLGQARPEDSARVVRRVVDAESLAPRLDVAAFNSAT